MALGDRNTDSGGGASSGPTAVTTGVPCPVVGADDREGAGRRHVEQDLPQGPEVPVVTGSPRAASIGGLDVLQLDEDLLHVVEQDRLGLAGTLLEHAQRLGAQGRPGEVGFDQVGHHEADRQHRRDGRQQACDQGRARKPVERAHRSVVPVRSICVLARWSLAKGSGPSASWLSTSRIVAVARSITRG